MKLDCNHQDAIAKISATVLFEDQRYTWLVVKDGKEIWALVDTVKRAVEQFSVLIP